MTKEERIKTIAEEGEKFLNPQLSHWFSFRVNDFLAEGIKLGVPPHDIPIILKCLQLTARICQRRSFERW